MNIIYKLVRVIDQEATARDMRKLQKWSKLSIREIARRAKYSAAFVSDLFIGRRNWTEKNCAIIKKAMTPPNRSQP